MLSIVKICKKITCKYVKYIFVILYNVSMVHWYLRFNFLPAIAKRQIILVQVAFNLLKTYGSQSRKKGHGIPFRSFSDYDFAIVIAFAVVGVNRPLFLKVCLHVTFYAHVVIATDIKCVLLLSSECWRENGSFTHSIHYSHYHHWRDTKFQLVITNTG